jgi:DNA recombination protein RmuC
MNVADFAFLAVGLLLGAAAAWSIAAVRAAENLRNAETEKARLTATLEGERSAAALRLSDVRAEQERLLEQFRALSSRALDENSKTFLRLADERFKASQTTATGELEQRKQAMEHLVSPIKESLGKVSDQLSAVEKERLRSHAELRQQLETMGKSSEQLRTETASLVNALRAPQVRGRWGEIQLRNIVESSGMVEHCDFVEQSHIATADGALRPDLVVRLAGGKQIVVDSKVSFNGYLEAMEARDDTLRAARLVAHARHLKKHIDDLASKKYWEHFEPTPEFVVMFVPAEVFLNSALEQDPTLLEHAFGCNVVIATPATLVALLRTVAYTWRQEALAKNAQDVLTLGRELHGRLSTMGTHLNKLGRQLNTTVRTYNDTVSSMESRVLVTARKMVDLKVSDATLSGTDQVELVARAVQAPELVASATDALVALPDAQDASEPDAEQATAHRSVG